jgi:hypothetical protein
MKCRLYLGFSFQIRGLLWVVVLLCLSVSLTYSQPTFRACFSPQSDCMKRLVKFIQAAKKSVYLQSYIFTSADIATALVKAKRRGVDVEIIVDKHQADCQHYTMLNALLIAGVPAWVDVGVGYNRNELVMIDDRYLVVGSFAFVPRQQASGASNFLWLDNPGIVHSYWQNWLVTKRRALALTRLACQP